MLDSHASLLRFFLPDIILENFDFKGVIQESETFHFQLEERNDTPEEWGAIKWSQRVFFRRLRFRIFLFAAIKCFFISNVVAGWISTAEKRFTGIGQLATEALQEMRIKYRWQALDAENEAIDKARKTKASFKAQVLPNGDTLKQLLARARYVLYKKPAAWTDNQKERAELLFERYPALQQDYNLSMGPSNIF